MARRKRPEQRRTSGVFHAIPTEVISSQSFKTLTPTASKVFLMIIDQLRYKHHLGTANNGNLYASLNLAKQWGINSPSTLRKCITELIEHGLIEQTLEVYFSACDRNRPNLYAVTYLAIDDCHKDVKETIIASAKWRNWKPTPKAPRKNKEPLESSNDETYLQDVLSNE